MAVTSVKSWTDNHGNEMVAEFDPDQKAVNIINKTQRITKWVDGFADDHSLREFWDALPGRER